MYRVSRAAICSAVKTYELKALTETTDITCMCCFAFPYARFVLTESYLKQGLNPHFLFGPPRKPGSSSSSAACHPSDHSWRESFSVLVLLLRRRRLHTMSAGQVGTQHIVPTSRIPRAIPTSDRMHTEGAIDYRRKRRRRIWGGWN
jgi:hypothetical protein